MTERELNTEEAFSRLSRLHRRLGLQADIRTLRNYDSVATCNLYDKHFHTISSGAGKGENCEIGALAESLEHYFIAASSPTLASSNVLLKEIEPFDDWLIKSIPENCEIPCFTLESLSGYETLNIPAILMAPSRKNAAAIDKTAARFLAKYATNSGMALGCTENEALLHAINEAIERHALSLYYLSLCGFAPPLQLYCPATSFLEEAFSHDNSLLRHAKTLDIFMSDEFYDVPFCIAISRTTKKRALCDVGSGCSINPHTALYRAVTEHLQCQKLADSTEKQADRTTSDMLSKSASLIKLLRPCPSITPPTLHPQPVNISVRGQLKRILTNLEKHNKKVFQRTLFAHPHLATVVQVYIPGFERFHLIRSGIPVAPQSAFKGKR